MIHCGWNYVIDCFMPISHKLKSPDMAVKSTCVQISDITKYPFLSGQDFCPGPSGYFVKCQSEVFEISFLGSHKSGPFVILMSQYHTVSLFTVEMVREEKMIM